MSVFCKKCGEEFIEIGIPASTVCALCEAESGRIKKVDERMRRQRVIETARALFVDAVYTPATCIKAAEEFEQAAEKYLKGEE